MADSRPRVVLDTVIYLQASISATNVASSVLKRADADEIELYVSKALVEEARDVLNRPSIRLKNARLSDEELARFLQSIESKARMIDPLPTHYRYGRDPNDEHILNLAIEVRAAFIVTHDNDLLALMDANRVEGAEFRQRYPEITILTPGQLLSHLNQL